MSQPVVSAGQKSLNTPVPVRFVHNGRPGALEAAAANDFEGLLAARPEILRAFAENGDLCWTVQTFCRLREAGYGNIELATEPAHGRINLSKAKTLSRRGWMPGLFDVSIQADYPHVAWARFHIQQNRDLLGHHAAFVPLWPQPALKPRDPSRDSVRRVGFIGKVDGNLAGSAELWRNLLAAEGLEFVAPDPGDWHDLSTLDIVVALRGFDRRRHSAKPANKLVNAWRAGIPFIGGNDSAYAQAGRPGTDYLQAITPDEVLGQIARLRADPALYRSLVEHGRKSARAFSTDAIVSEWVSLLEGPVAQRYTSWEQHPRVERLSGQSLALAQASLDRAKALGRLLLRREFEA